MWLYEYMSDRAIITQAVCVLAIHIASKRSVPERIASLSLSPLPPATDADAAVTPAAQQEQVAWYCRLRFSPRKFGRAILPILILVAFEFFVLGILPRISSQMVYNGFFIALIAMVLGVTINNNFVFFFGGATKLVLFRKEKATLVKRLPADTSDRKFSAKQRNSMSAAAVLTAGVILLTSYDVNNYAIPFVVGAMVINTFNSITFNKLTTRGLTLVSMGLVALIFALIPIIGVIVLVCQNFIPEGDEGNDSVPSDSETAVAMLPNWILRLLVLQSDLMMAAPAMFLVAFALRYDHLGPSSALRLTASKAAPGEGVVVPQLIERRPTPTYKVAMASLIGTYLLIDVTVHTLLAHDILSFSDAKNVENARGATIMLASFILTNTVVPSALVLYAWSKGEARQWWTCVEIWAPTDEDTAQEASAGDVEKAENGAEREEGLLASENKALLA